jgi:Spy/CpxP family protein refolding chaperone
MELSERRACALVGQPRSTQRQRPMIRDDEKQYGVMQIVELTNLSWPAVRVAIDLYEAGGMAALKPKERGKKSGEGRSLTPEQEAHIRKLIADQRPEQPRSADQGRSQESLSHPRQSARPSFQDRKGLAHRAERSNRGVLSAELRARTQSGRAAERRHEARHRSQSAGADEIEIDGCGLASSRV